MNFEEYRKLTGETAIYPKERSAEYLVPALLGEIGELAGVIAKKVRDDTEESVYREKLESEGGDIEWMLAELANRINDGQGTEAGAHIPMAIEVCFNMVSLLRDLSRGVNMGNKPMVLSHLRGIGQHFDVLMADLGVDREVSREKNIAKLQSRKERGVIGGSGDSR